MDVDWWTIPSATRVSLLREILRLEDSVTQQVSKEDISLGMI